jgi:hypothetical protein
MKVAVLYVKPGQVSSTDVFNNQPEPSHLFWKMMVWYSIDDGKIQHWWWYDIALMMVWYSIDDTMFSDTCLITALG